MQQMENMNFTPSQPDIHLWYAPKEASKQIAQKTPPATTATDTHTHRQRETERERANQGFALQQTEAATYDGVRTLKEGSIQLHRKLPTG